MAPRTSFGFWRSARTSVVGARLGRWRSPRLLALVGLLGRWRSPRLALVGLLAPSRSHVLRAHTSFAVGEQVHRRGRRAAGEPQRHGHALQAVLDAADWPHEPGRAQHEAPARGRAGGHVGAQPQLGGGGGAPARAHRHGLRQARAPLRLQGAGAGGRGGHLHQVQVGRGQGQVPHERQERGRGEQRARHRCTVCQL
jgi:hypothetical protein